MRNERRCPSRGGRHFKNKSTPVIMLSIMIILFVFWGVGCGEENLHNNEISTSNPTTITTVDETTNTKTANAEENTITNIKTNTHTTTKTEEKTSKTNKTTTTKRISETETKATTKKITTTTKNITKTTTTTTTKNTTKATTKKTTTAEVYSSEGKNLGRFYITVYTPGSDGGGWGYQTSTGVRSKHLQTCAVDPRVIPLGSKIYVNGLTLLACDVGGAIKGSHIDIFYDGSESAAIRWVSNFGEHHDVILLS